MSPLQAAREPANGWLRLDTVFWLTIALVFVFTIASALVRRRQRDRALRLLDGSRVTLVPQSGRAVTGRLVVESQGVEIVFEHPEPAGPGIAKSSMLVYEPELASIAAIVRATQDLEPDERRRREAHLRALLHPGPWHAFWRAARNLFNTARDAVLQSLPILVGRFRPAGNFGAALRAQEQGLVGFGGTVLTANAYEPLLERRAGAPVIVHVPRAGKPDPTPPPLELAGHLAAYSDRYLCVMAEDGPAARGGRLESPSRAAAAVEGDGLRIERAAQTARLVAKGSDAVVVREVRAAGRELPGAGAVLLPDAWIELEDGGEGALEVGYELTRTVDLVAPRARAQVRHAAALHG